MSKDNQSAGLTHREPLGIMAGSADAENMIADLAKIRKGKGISPEELASAMACAVIDQYKGATSIVSRREHILKRDMGAAIAGGVGIGATVVGLASAIALDIGIMGGSAHELFEANAWLLPMASGLIVYGTGLYASVGRKYYHAGVLSLGVIASAGAAAVISDNPVYSNHYQNVVSSMFDGANAGVDKANNTLSIAKAKLQQDLDKEQDLKDHINGNAAKGVLAIDADHNPYNDGEKPALIQSLKELTEDKPTKDGQPAKVSIIASDRAAVMTAQNEYDVEARRNPARNAGRALGFLSFFAPLTTSLIVFDLIMSNMKRRSDKYKADRQALNMMEDLIKGLEDPATMRSTALKEVEKMMTRLDRIATLEAQHDAEKVDNIADLFRGQSRIYAREMAIEIICGSLTGESGFAQMAPGFHKMWQDWKREHGGYTGMQNKPASGIDPLAAETVRPGVEPDVDAPHTQTNGMQSSASAQPGSEGQQPQEFDEKPDPAAKATQAARAARDAADVAPGKENNQAGSQAQKDDQPDLFRHFSGRKAANSKGNGHDNGVGKSAGPNAADASDTGPEAVGDSDKQPESAPRRPRYVDLSLRVHENGQFEVKKKGKGTTPPTAG